MILTTVQQYFRIRRLLPGNSEASVFDGTFLCLFHPLNLRSWCSNCLAVNSCDSSTTVLSCLKNRVGMSRLICDGILPLNNPTISRRLEYSLLLVAACTLPSAWCSQRYRTFLLTCWHDEWLRGIDNPNHLCCVVLTYHALCTLYVINLTPGTPYHTRCSICLLVATPIPNGISCKRTLAPFYRFHCNR